MAKKILQFTALLLRSATKKSYLLKLTTKNYYKLRQKFMAEWFLQIVFIFITNYSFQNYYKLRQKLLQITAGITNCVVTIATNVVTALVLLTDDVSSKVAELFTNCANPFLVFIFSRVITNCSGIFIILADSNLCPRILSHV